MNYEGKRKICQHCNGFGGRLKLKKAEGMGFSRDPKLVKEDCPACWGRGYVEFVEQDIPDKDQEMKYLMYP